MCAKCIDKMSASEIYGILKGRVISLPDLKKELHDTKAALKQVIHEMSLWRSSVLDYALRTSLTSLLASLKRLTRSLLENALISSLR